jgi:hypothetical protein
MKLFWAIIRISGGACIFVAILGYILGKFDYVLEINNAALPLIDGEVAIALIVVGIVFLALGFWLGKRAEKKDGASTAIPQLDINNLEFIEKAIRRTRRRNYIMGIFLFAFGGFMCWVPFVDPEADPSSGGSIFLYCFGGLVLILGGFMLFKAVQMNNIHNTTIYQTIMLNPKVITGLDVQIVQSAYTKHSKQINVHLFISTQKLAVLSVNDTELELLRQYLMRHNPNLQYSQNAQIAG